METDTKSEQMRGETRKDYEVVREREQSKEGKSEGRVTLVILLT